MVDVYRKHAGHLHDWHFNPHCPEWPEGDYIQQTERPPEEAICTKCAELESPEQSDPENR